MLVNVGLVPSSWGHLLLALGTVQADARLSQLDTVICFAYSSAQLCAVDIGVYGWYGFSPMTTMLMILINLSVLIALLYTSAKLQILNMVTVNKIINWHLVRKNNTNHYSFIFLNYFVIDCGKEMFSWFTFDVNRVLKKFSLRPTCLKNIQSVVMVFFISAGLFIVNTLLRLTRHINNFEAMNPHKLMN